MNRSALTAFILASLASLVSVHGAPTGSSVQKQNALDAQKLNAQFATFQASDSCNEGRQACVTSQLAQCVEDAWQLTPCSSNTTCVALPLVNKEGTSIGCETQSVAIARFQDAGVDGGLTGSDFGSLTGVTSATDPTATASESSSTSPIFLTPPTTSDVSTASDSRLPTTPSSTYIPTDTSTSIDSASTSPVLRKRQRIFTTLHSGAGAVSDAGDSTPTGSASTTVAGTTSAKTTAAATPSTVGNGASTVTVVSTVTVTVTDSGSSASASASDGTPSATASDTTSSTASTTGANTTIRSASSSSSSTDAAFPTNIAVSAAPPTIVSAAPTTVAGVSTSASSGSSSATPSTSSGVSTSASSSIPSSPSSEAASATVTTPATLPTDSAEVSNLITATL